jgi:hypothetical protein
VVPTAVPSAASTALDNMVSSALRSRPPMLERVACLYGEVAVRSHPQAVYVAVAGRAVPPLSCCSLFFGHQ